MPEFDEHCAQGSGNARIIHFDRNISDIDIGAYDVDIVLREKREREREKTMFVSFFPNLLVFIDKLLCT